MASAVHTVVGDFRQRRALPDVLVELRRVGFGPDRISIVADDPGLARELGGRSFVGLGVAAGIAAGIVFTLAVILMGGDAMPVNSPGFVLGALGVIGGLGFIGLVLGRAIVQRSTDAAVFASEVERGDVLVAVCCSGETCAHARDVLLAAGAEDVREEAGAGP